MWSLVRIQSSRLLIYYAFVLVFQHESVFFLLACTVRSGFNKILNKLKHSRWRFARFRSETSVSETKVADFLKALIISNSKFVRTGSELI